MHLTVRSAAKVNLGLWVGSRRPDGFHDIVTTMAPLTLADDVQVETVRAGIRVSCDSPVVPAGPSNLAHRAATAFFARTGVAAGCRVRIRKRIPVGSGLGGGSSNAAAVLRALNRLFGDPLSRLDLCQVGAALGSDVPFFLQVRPCVARGRGERLRPIRLPRLSLLLHFPGYAVETAWAYRELDRRRRRPPGLTSFRLSPKILGLRLRRGELDRAAAQLRNSFEPVVFRRHPGLARAKKLLLRHGAFAAALSGSGSTVYGLVNAQGWHDPMAALKRLGLHCILTQTCQTV
jgi:4-diphosphocytidyl-2-C-methyl-D-erythritol kinase